MHLRNKTSGSAVVLALLVMLTPSVVAQKKGFDGIVEHLEQNYHGKRTKIPMLGFANFVVKIIRPAGVKSFKLAVFEGQDFTGGGNSLGPAMHTLMKKEWQPFVRVSGGRYDPSSTYIYAKASGKDLELMTVVMEPRQAVVVEVKLNPDGVARFLNDPKIMGISLAGSFSGKSGGSLMGGSVLAGGSSGSYRRGGINIDRGNSDVGRRIDPRDEAGYSLTGVATPKPDPPPAAPAPERPVLKAVTAEEADLTGQREGETPIPTNPETIAAAAAASEARAAERASKDAIRIDTQLVNLNIKAVDKANKPLSTLTRNDFVVYEDGIRQEITYFDPVSAPINLVLLLDLSGSTSDKRGIMLSAAKKFVDSLSPQDRIAVAAFTREYYVVSDFTTDRQLIKERLGSLRKVSGGTAFYDAVWTTLDLLAKVNDSRKAVVVLTDGVDEKLLSEGSGSKRPFDLVLERAQEEDVSIYPIYLDAEIAQITKDLEDPDLKERSRQRMIERRLRPREKALKQLEALAEGSAGYVFKAEDEQDLDGVYQHVAAELRMLYSLAYSPENSAKDGRFRKINVEVKREGVALRTRRGYIAK
jgi:VWFA-related protein